MAGIAASLAMQLLLPALLGGNGRRRSSHPIVVGTGRRKRRRRRRRLRRGRIHGRGLFGDSWRVGFPMIKHVVKGMSNSLRHDM